ncbi:MAG: TIM barrel protein [Planctomycetes bacterium]|nr:TIM barrel protein [Planctomycetota bacterium]
MSIQIGVIAGVVREQGVKALQAAKDLGFDGVEYFVPPPWENREWLDKSFQKEMRQASQKFGVSVSSLALAYLNQVPLASPDAAVRHATLQSLLDYIPVAKALGAREILLAFYGQGELAFQRQRAALVDQLKAAAPAAEKARVGLGIESTLTSRQYLDILDRVGSPAVNIYLDMCNPYFWLHDTAEQIRSLGGRIGQIHMKEGSVEGPGGKDLGEGFNRWDEITSALQEIRYKGWAVLETSSNHGNPHQDARMNLERARKILAPCQ